MRIGKVFPAVVGLCLASSLLMGQDRPAAKKPALASYPGATKTRPALSPEFGGTQIQYQRVTAMQFTSDVSTDTYTSTWNPAFGGYNYQRYFNGDGFNHLVSSVTLPGGARIVYIEFDACDTNASGQTAQLTTWNCDYRGGCDSAPMSTLTTTNGDGCTNYNDTSISYRIDNFLDQVLLDVTFGATDGTNTFAGVIIGYVLEVSPAPGTATFNDVPTNHPFFQYIEALAASGVTGGCSAAPPLYCPDNFVTRGQMAVFLSKLTGLSWTGQ